MMAPVVLLLWAAVEAPVPLVATLTSIAVSLPDPDHVVLELKARGPTGRLAPLVSHQLWVGSIPLPLEGPPDVSLLDGGFEARARVDLAQVPEAVLELNAQAVGIRYQAHDSKGNPVLQAAGTLDLADQEQVRLPIQRLYELYIRVDRWNLQPSLTQLGFSALLSLYNPLGFPLTVRRVDFSVVSGETPLVTGSRPGIRLLPRRRSDVLLEQAIPLTALGGAAQALVQGKPLTLQGVLVLATPKGDAALPFLLGSGPETH